MPNEGKKDMKNLTAPSPSHKNKLINKGNKIGLWGLKSKGIPYRIFLAMLIYSASSHHNG